MGTKKRPELVLAPVMSQLSIIRGETVLSAMPIHNLAKKGKLNIQITKKRQGRKIYFKWEVSYSERFGQPRALAYKLDTLIINRRIEEASRPLPEILPLGSLRDIAKELGLGTNTAPVKTALRQNASAFISAKIHYFDVDGVERDLEADFSRYGVVFTGEKLPSGQKADGVYLILNAPYRDVLNNAPWRPLNYDYLKELPPGPQRFYEIISYRIFAALKYGHETAKITYSEYCIFSAQMRYFDYDHFKKQMYKIHRPHLKSSYLAKVSFTETRDEDGKLDWEMHYTPGQAAKEEYETFSKKRAALAAEDGVDEGILAKLMVRGIAESEARRLLQGCAPNQRIEDQIEWVDYLFATSPPGKFTSPAGFLFTFIERNLPVPYHKFETSRMRREREEAEQAALDRIVQDQQHDAIIQDETDDADVIIPEMVVSNSYLRFQQEQAYENYLREESNRYFEEDMPDSSRESLLRECREEMDRDMPHIATWKEQTKQNVLWSIVEKRLRTIAPLPSFEEFIATHWNPASSGN